MMGWHISVHRQANGGSAPAMADSKEGARIAVWQADLEGLEWLNELVADGKAIDLGGNGYPNHYTAKAEYLLPPIVDGPPEARRRWVCGPDDVLGAAWEGRTVIDRAVADDCRMDEWLLVVAWDES